MNTTMTTHRVPPNGPQDAALYLALLAVHDLKDAAIDADGECLWGLDKVRMERYRIEFVDIDRLVALGWVDDSQGYDTLRVTGKGAVVAGEVHQVQWGETLVLPLFSDADADLSRLKWRADRYGYARTTFNHPKPGGGQTQTHKMAHRMVMERVAGRPLTSADIVDHINGDRTDNRRENLRITDHTGNSQNRRPYGALKVRGVTLHKPTGKFQVRVWTKGKGYYLGLFDNLEVAAAVAEAKRREFGFLRRSV